MDASDDDESPKREHPAVEAEQVRLGRFLPTGMLVGAGVGLVVGLLTGRPGIAIPVGIALGILVAGTVPVFARRR